MRVPVLRLKRAKVAIGGSRPKLCQLVGRRWLSGVASGRVVRSGLNFAGSRLQRIKAPRCEVSASRRGLTFGSSTSLGPNSRISPFISQASPSLLPTAALSVERLRAAVPATASAGAILQPRLSASSPPMVAVAGQPALSRQRAGPMPPPRAGSPPAHPRGPAMRPGADGRVPVRGLS